MISRPRGVGRRIRASLSGGIAHAALLFLAACGSSTSPTGTPGMCGAAVPAGTACDTIANVATAITPTCTTATMPSGSGGTIVEGTYVMTSQTYYGTSGCASTSLAATFVYSAGCVQEITTAAGISITATVSLDFHDTNQVTKTVECVYPSLAGATVDTPTVTFTATPTSLTLFTHNSGTGSANPDRVESFQKL